ncbi:MAG: SufD family Fe-S cluster assembly protein [Mycoplasmataceae bacterium]|nr:SufD family Fe-S cluster assembly protein [Mycoplasmataceae bacterium]
MQNFKELTKSEKIILTLKDKTNNYFFIDVNNTNININIECNLKQHQDLNLYVYSLNKSSAKNFKININHSPYSKSNTFIKTFAINKGNTNIELISTINKNNTNVEAHQTIDGILFDDLSKINVIPSMVVDSNSIKSSHSVNIGNINPEQLFYLMSRGISKDKSTALLLDSMFSGIKDLKDKQAVDLYEKLNKTLLSFASQK